MLRGARQDAIAAPAAVAGKPPQGHDFDFGNPEVGHPLQYVRARSSGEGAIGADRPDLLLADHLTSEGGRHRVGLPVAKARSGQQP